MNTIDLIQSYRMTDLPLTADEYTHLSLMRDTMHTLVHHPEQDVKNPDHSWWSTMQPIYSRVFNAPFPGMGCKACRIDTLKRLYHKLTQYEQTQANN